MASKHQTKTIELLKVKGWKVLNIVRLGESGFPDLLALKNGVAIWVECKEATDTLKPLQQYRLNELQKLGFKTFVEQDGKESELKKYLNK